MRSALPAVSSPAVSPVPSLLPVNTPPSSGSVAYASAVLDARPPASDAAGAEASSWPSLGAAAGAAAGAALAAAEAAGLGAAACSVTALPTVERTAAPPAPPSGIEGTAVTRSRRRHGGGKGRLQHAQVREEGTAIGAILDERARGVQLTCREIWLSRSEGRDQSRVVPCVRGRSCGHLRFGHVLRETTSLDGRFPATHVAAIIAPPRGCVRGGARRTAPPRA
jgi:hypothetical protein